jgi:hypothetical protein
MSLHLDPVVDAARRLTRRAGLAEAVQVERMAGGRNNRVFRIALADGGTVVLKSYFHDLRDPRNRLAAEWGFLSYGWARKIRSIPQPLARENETHSALYSFVEGRRLAPGEVGAVHADAAAGFLLELNAARDGDDPLGRASEACFSIAEHIATVERRVAQLHALDPAVPHRDDAAELISAILVPTWERVRRRVVEEAQTLGIAPDRPISGAERVISPSDFGFHNALEGADGRLVFLDFEYAGMDDLAKLVCDFFCQPEVPVALAYFERFLERLIAGLDIPGSAEARCRLLLDAYRIKWACIILNEFRPLGAARRMFAEPEAWQSRCLAQLRKARAKIAEIPSH